MFALMLSFFLSFFFSVATTSYASSTPGLAFADPQLEAAVRLAVSKASGALMPEDVQGLQQLDASACGISDLRGIEALTGLMALAMGSNKLSDLTPLTGLPASCTSSCTRIKSAT